MIVTSSLLISGILEVLTFLGQDIHRISRTYKKYEFDYALQSKFWNINSSSWNSDGKFYRSSWSWSAHRRSRRSPLRRACTILLYCPKAKKKKIIDTSEAHIVINTVNINYQMQSSWCMYFCENYSAA